MTREEAIHIVDMAFNIPLAVRRSGEDRTYHEAEIREAKRMAIEALKQELCDDAVSRQAVDKLIDELARAISDERCFMSRGRSTATIMQDILDLPSVSTEKTGQWEEYGTRQVQILPTYRCSVCGEEYLQSEHFKYCPNCGAKNATTALQGRK